MLLRERGLTVLKADEGGYGPPLESHAAALELLDTAVERAGLRLGDDVAYAIDVAATHFFEPDTGRYALASEGRTLHAGELAELVAELADRHPIAVGRGRAGRGRLGRLGRASPSGSAAGCRYSVTISSRRTSSGSSAASSAAPRTPCS